MPETRSEAKIRISAIKEWLDKEPELHEETLRERIYETALEVYKRKEEVVGAEMMRHFEKGVMLQTLDSLWKEHLAAMDYLRQGIHLRGYAQKDPKQEYREGFALVLLLRIFLRIATQVDPLTQVVHRRQVLFPQ